jgi:hypothetical protein
MAKRWKGAILVCGESGTGKSRWIREEAAAQGARLFRWNVRTDRSLREGREILHTQVRSKEHLFVWIEGADDLTQEAQAFLRRILETAAPNVTCVLEVREMWKLSPPVLSRCTVVPIKTDISIRQQMQIQRAFSLGLIPSNLTVGLEQHHYSWRDIPALRASATDPHVILQTLLKETPILSAKQTDLVEMIRAFGAGSSLWIQLANYWMRKERTTSSAGTK